LGPKEKQRPEINNRFKVPTSRRQTSWLYTSAAEELRRGNLKQT